MFRSTVLARSVWYLSKRGRPPVYLHCLPKFVMWAVGKALAFVNFLMCLFAFQVYQQSWVHSRCYLPVTAAIYLFIYYLFYRLLSRPIYLSSGRLALTWCMCNSIIRHNVTVSHENMDGQELSLCFMSHNLFLIGLFFFANASCFHGVIWEVCEL